jgi:hypothetical protein
MVDLIVLTSLDHLLFKLKLLFTFFYKTTNLNEEVNCAEPSASVSIPCMYTCMAWSHGEKRYVLCHSKLVSVSEFSWDTKLHAIPPNVPKQTAEKFFNCFEKILRFRNKTRECWFSKKNGLKGKKSLLKRRHDIQPIDTQNNYTQLTGLHCHTQHNGAQNYGLWKKTHSISNFVVPYFLLLCWVSFGRVSFCWLSRRLLKQRGLIRRLNEDPVQKF